MTKDGMWLAIAVFVGMFLTAGAVILQRVL
jgi:hypothetical protein